MEIIKIRVSWPMAIHKHTHSHMWLRLKMSELYPFFARIECVYVFGMHIAPSL